MAFSLASEAALSIIMGQCKITEFIVQEIRLAGSQRNVLVKDIGEPEEPA